MNFHKNKIIAIDFDGTIVEDRYPKIGPEQIFAFATMKKLQQQGHKLVLWTLRSGKRLEEAVAFCEKNGIEFYAVNENYKDEVLDKKTPRKIYADIYIDDRNAGGFIGWGKVHHLFLGESGHMQKHHNGLLSSMIKRALRVLKKLERNYLK